MGMLQLATLAPESEKQGFVDRALAASALLTALLDDTLDVTRLEHGRAILNVGPISLPALARSCIELVQPSAAPKHIELKLHVEEEVASAGECVGDARRLTQVLLNLLNNAIKFTPNHGSVHLGLATRREPAADPGVLPLCFSVTDTGIGIRPEDIDNVFLKYTKASDGTGGTGVNRHAGAGLGLSISKAIVEQLHRGKITVESTPGEGSTFTVSLDLPLATPEQQAPQTVAALTQNRHEFSGCRVLVADDVAMNRDVVGGMLESLGCAVVEVADGAAAVDAVKHQSQETGFDAVFMDVQMPGMNGLEATAAIRALEAEGGRGERLPIIALTGFVGQDEQRERCQASGMDGFMTKPLAVTTAREMLRVHVKGRKRVTAATAAAADGGGAGDGGNPAPAAATDEPAVDVSIFDPENVLELVGGNTAVLKRLLQKFDCSPMLLEARAALAEADATKLRNAAHAMKGQLKYMQAHAAAEAAHALEKEARALEGEHVDAHGDGAWGWSGECKERLTVMAATLRVEVERVDANRRAVLAELDA